MEMKILNKRTFANAYAKRWIRYLIPFVVIVSFMVFSFAVSSEDTVLAQRLIRALQVPSTFSRKVSASLTSTAVSQSSFKMAIPRKGVSAVPRSF